MDSSHKDSQIGSPRKLELAVFGTLSSEWVEHSAVDVKHLYTVVVGVADDDLVRVGDGDVVRVL